MLFMKERYAEIQLQETGDSDNLMIKKQLQTVQNKHIVKFKIVEDYSISVYVNHL